MLTNILRYSVLILFVVVALIGARMTSTAASGSPPAMSGMAFLLAGIAGALLSTQMCRCTKK